MNLSALVVDDEEIVRMVIESILVSSGFDVALAKNGEDALEKLKHIDFDIICTDLEMGEVDGFEVARNARRLQPGTIVLMITGNLDPFTEAEAYRCGIDEYLTKPIEADELIGRLRRHQFVRGPKVLGCSRGCRRSVALQV